MSSLRMILFSFFGLTFFFSTSIAAPPPEARMDLVCVTEIPTTSFVVTEEDKDWVDVMILHHNGSQYAPVMDSLLTPNDLELFKEQSEMVKKLGDRLSFKWKRSGCNADSAMFFQCSGEAQDFEVNGIKVHPWALTVNEITTKNLWGTFEKKNLNLRFSVDQKNYQITMDYSPDDCVSSIQKSQYQEKLKLIQRK